MTVTRPDAVGRFAQAVVTNHQGRSASFVRKESPFVFPAMAAK